MRSKRRYILILAVAGLMIGTASSLTSSGLALAEENISSLALAPTPMLNGKIAFTSTRDGNSEIYLMNSDGTNQVRITNNTWPDDDPAWSPEGRKIAFVSQKQDGSFAIFMMNADGTDRTEITALALNAPQWGTWAHLSWSPDGEKIAFHDFSATSASIDIFVVNRDGSGRKNLTADPHMDLFPTWSPDGSKILFSRYDLYDPPGWGGTMLHTMNADGTNLTRLANGFADGWNEDFPDWSAATNKIVYSVNEWDFVFSLYIANPDGTGRQFFHGCDWTAPSCKSDALSPAFSPDGTKIAFGMFDFVHSTPQKLYVKNLDGTGLTLLTDNGASPSWQPLMSGCPNPIDCNEFFVRQHYRDFLGREPDPAGLAGWLNILNNCGITIVEPCDRIEVSSAFFRSPEFQGRGYFIYRFYPTIAKVPIRSEFMPDFARVSGFLTDAQLEAAKATFVSDFMARSEFQSRYASTFNNPTAYVDALLQTVGLPNHPLRQAWINSLSGNNSPASRAQVLRSLVESAEVYQKYYNEAFVLMQYFGYLRRSADAAYLDWIQTMNQNGGDYRVMINGFLNSTEYRQRFGSQ